MKQAFITLLMWASVGIYSLVCIQITYKYFQNDKKHIKKWVGIFILGIIVGVSIIYFIKHE